MMTVFILHMNLQFMQHSVARVLFAPFYVIIDGAEIIQISLIYSCTICLSWEDSGITRAPKAPLSFFLGSLCMIRSLYHCVLRAMGHLMYQPRMGCDQSRKSQSISSASLVHMVTKMSRSRREK